MRKEVHRFIILTDGEHSISPYVPTSLVPLGHHPIICILIRTLFEVSENGTIALIVKQEQAEMYTREMRRWFPRKPITVVPTLQKHSSPSLIEYLASLPPGDDNGSYIVLQANFPFLSKSTLDDFLVHSEKEPFAVLGTSRSRWNEDRSLFHLEVHRKQVLAIDQGKDFSHYGFLPCFKAGGLLLKEFLPQVEEFYQVPEKSPTKPVLIHIPSFPGELDTISIKSPEDKIYAENRFMEKQNADFLSHCYRIWNQCKQMEARIESLENIVQKK